MPPLLMRVPDATWVAVLTLLVLQTSFLVPPMGYAVLMIRHRLERPIGTARFVRALSPYLVAQLLVLVMVLAYPASVWRGPMADASPPTESAPVSDEESGQFERPQEFDGLDTSRREAPPAEFAPSDPDKQ